MRWHMTLAAQAHPAFAVTSFEQAVDPVVHGLEFARWPAAGGVVDDRHMPETAAEIDDLRRIAGTIHEVAK